MEVMFMETRVCIKCGLEKPLSEFNKNGKYYRTNCKECKKEYEHNQYLQNRDKVLERSRKYDLEHRKERIEYRRLHKDHIKEKNQQYYIENKEKIQEYRKKHAEDISAQQKKYRTENKEHIKELAKEYYKKNPHYHRDYDKKRMEVDELYKFKKLVRTMIKSSFRRKGLRKTKGTAHIVGCDYKYLQEYLLGTYKNNYGLEWDGEEAVHIDHIIPLATANTEEEIIKLCHYTNLQLLKGEDNLLKSDKLDWKVGDK